MFLLPFYGLPTSASIIYDGSFLLKTPDGSFDRCLSGNGGFQTCDSDVSNAQQQWMAMSIVAEKGKTFHIFFLLQARRDIFHTFTIMFCKIYSRAFLSPKQYAYKIVCLSAIWYGNGSSNVLHSSRLLIVRIRRNLLYHLSLTAFEIYCRQIEDSSFKLQHVQDDEFCLSYTGVSTKVTPCEIASKWTFNKGNDALLVSAHADQSLCLGSLPGDDANAYMLDCASDEK